MKRLTQAVPAAFLALAITHQATAQSPPRAVKNASIQLITGDDGKDDSDVFIITVTNAEGKFLERVKPAM